MQVGSKVILTKDAKKFVRENRPGTNPEQTFTIGIIDDGIETVMIAGSDDDKFWMDRDDLKEVE